MNSPIKTNQLAYRLDKELFSKTYDVFCVCTTEKYFKHGAYILDAPLLNENKNVRSVLFRSGREFFVLMKRSDTNSKLLRETISKADGSDDITISKITIDTLNEAIALQLMLNSLSNYETPLLKFNNLTGHLYCSHPDWLKRKGGVIAKVPCLDLKISPEFRLNMDVRTFTSVRLRSKIDFKKRKFEEYPKYSFSANNTLSRKLKDDKGDAFILRQTKNDRSEITFLDIHSLDKFNQSKMGVIATTIENFNNRFSDIAHLEFISITDYKSLDYTTSVANENTQAIKKLLSIKPIKIVDCIDGEYSKIFCKEISDLLISEYGIKASIGKEIAKDHLNIRVIHSADYYADGKDQHKVFDDATVQHITYEDFSGSSKHAISSVIHEMLIKDDLNDKKISLFDWKSLGIGKDIDFGIEVKDEDENLRYIFMTVHPDGTFDISTMSQEETVNLFKPNEYEQCIDVFLEAEIKDEKVYGIIRDDSGNINVIKETGWFTIPEIDHIKAELSKGNTKLRGKEKRDELFSSCLDIKMFSDGSSYYYFVGAIGNGMKRTIHRAAIIRKIEAYETSELIFDELLPLMNVTFVHNGQLTITPFPFKYLREFVNRLDSQ